MLTFTSGLKFVLSSELAPIRIHGVCPVLLARFERAFKKKVLGDAVPAQSVHRSCSIEKESNAGLSSMDDGGAVAGMETESEMALARTKKERCTRILSADVLDFEHIISDLPGLFERSEGSQVARSWEITFSSTRSF